MFDDEREDDPQEETAFEDTAPEEATAPDEPVSPAAEEAAAAEDEPSETPAAEEEPDEAGEAEAAESGAGEEQPPEPAAEPEPGEPAAEPPKPRARRDRQKEEAAEPEVIPGAHLEPDLVLEDEAAAAERVGELAGAEIEAAEEALESGLEPEPPEPREAPIPTTVLELAADARYRATGKRKSAVARVILKPGSGDYLVNGRPLAEFFPRPTLQKMARGPLDIVGQAERMDVLAKIHGGGVSAQAGALRHDIARALVEADPNLRGELKRRGFLTRDPRVKERKKAGLKKARKRPQFSKR